MFHRHRERSGKGEPPRLADLVPSFHPTRQLSETKKHPHDHHAPFPSTNYSMMAKPTFLLFFSLAATSAYAAEASRPRGVAPECTFLLPSRPAQLIQSFNLPLPSAHLTTLLLI
jgi:hypothetical protein